MIYLTNEGLFKKALGGLSAEQLAYRPTENNTPIIWIAGHIAQTRAFVLKLMGEDFDTGWGDLFGRGAVLKDASAYPPVEEIQGTMDKVSERLQAKIASLGEEDCARPATGPNLPNATSLIEQVAFLALHESYHVGQLAYIRKSLGFAGMVG
jgi:uncharacterized damage-inducible protein DinB